jgi:2-dehydropantoate 2-reductase
VELFAGTIRRLGRSLNIATPVNDWLYQRIQEIEAAY